MRFAVALKSCVGFRYFAMILSWQGLAVILRPRSRIIQALAGNTLDRATADAGYRGRNAPSNYKLT